jgi:hypothetical protein
MNNMQSTSDFAGFSLPNAAGLSPRPLTRTAFGLLELTGMCRKARYTCNSGNTLGEIVKVRITEKPREHELDGVRLDGYLRGMVRDVSPLMGAWLITEGYAEPEMRQTREDDQEFGRFRSVPHPLWGQRRQCAERRRHRG